MDQVLVRETEREGVAKLLQGDLLTEKINFIVTVIFVFASPGCVGLREEW